MTKRKSAEISENTLNNESHDKIDETLDESRNIKQKIDDACDDACNIMHACNICYTQKECLQMKCCSYDICVDCARQWYHDKNKCLHCNQPVLCDFIFKYKSKSFCDENFDQIKLNLTNIIDDTDTLYNHLEILLWQYKFDEFQLTMKYLYRNNMDIDDLYDNLFESFVDNPKTCYKIIENIIESSNETCVFIDYNNYEDMITETRNKDVIKCILDHKLVHPHYIIHCLGPYPEYFDLVMENYEIDQNVLYNYIKDNDEYLILEKYIEHYKIANFCPIYNDIIESDNINTLQYCLENNVFTVDVFLLLKLCCCHASYECLEYLVSEYTFNQKQKEICMVFTQMSSVSVNMNKIHNVSKVLRITNYPMIASILSYDLHANIPEREMIPKCTKENFESMNIYSITYCCKVAIEKKYYKLAKRCYRQGICKEFYNPELYLTTQQFCELSDLELV